MLEKRFNALKGRSGCYIISPISSPGIQLLSRCSVKIGHSENFQCGKSTFTVLQNGIHFFNGFNTPVGQSPAIFKKCHAPFTKRNTPPFSHNMEFTSFNNTIDQELRLERQYSQKTSLLPGMSVTNCCKFVTVVLFCAAQFQL